MGLSSQLEDVSSGSIPILLVVTAFGWASYLRSLLHCLFHSLTLGLHRLPSSTDDSSASAFSPLGSTLANLIALADHRRTNPSFSYKGEPRCGHDCSVCLCGLRVGEQVRKLKCCHVFHSECLDGWFDQMNLSCPLCRSPLVAEERCAEAEQRIGADLVAWLSAPAY